MCGFAGTDFLITMISLILPLQYVSKMEEMAVELRKGNSYGEAKGI